MKNLFLPYEIALKLKEKGFNEPTLAHFNTETEYGRSNPVITVWQKYDVRNLGELPAPLLQQVIDWFREKHKVHISINEDFDNGKFLGYFGLISDKNGFTEMNTKINYHEALTDAIEHVLKIKLFNIILKN